MTKGTASRRVCDLDGSASKADLVSIEITHLLLRRASISAVPVHHRSQAKVFPQGRTFILGPEQPPPSQLWNDHLDEILAPTWQRGRCDVETIARIGFEPLLHGISDVRRRTDPCRTGEAGSQIQLTDRRLFPSDPLDKLSADAAKLLIAQRLIGHRAVQVIA